MRRVAQAREAATELFEVRRGNSLPAVRGSLWAAYNAVTEFVDHHHVAGSDERRLDSIWFGDGYLTKARAYRVAVEKAGA